MSKTCPLCIMPKKDCFACSDGRCTILTNCEFDGRACPFHKTREQVAKECQACKQWLIELGLEALVEKYGGFRC